jgi:hypothetical protein
VELAERTARWHRARLRRIHVVRNAHPGDEAEVFLQVRDRSQRRRDRVARARLGWRDEVAVLRHDLAVDALDVLLVVVAAERLAREHDPVDRRQRFT